MKTTDVLNKILDNKGLNAKSFSEAIGLNRPQAIYDIQKGKTKAFSQSMIDKILSVFPDIDRSWLLTGEGNMLKKKEADVEDTNYGADTYQLVPLMNIDAVGGMDSSNDVTITEPEYILRMMAFNNALPTDRCICITGNSMAPTCPSGSYVLIREVENWREYFGYGSIFVVLLNDSRRIVKEIVKCDGNSREYVTCVSHNNGSQTEDLPKDMIKSVWKVIQILNNRGW